MERPDNKFNREWKDRLSKEMLRFQGKAPALPEGAESVSDNTSELKSQKTGAQQRPKSALKAPP